MIETKQIDHSRSIQVECATIPLNLFEVFLKQHDATSFWDLIDSHILSIALDDTAISSNFAWANSSSPWIDIDEKWHNLYTVFSSLNEHISHRDMYLFYNFLIVEDIVEEYLNSFNKSFYTDSVFRGTAYLILNSFQWHDAIKWSALSVKWGQYLALHTDKPSIPSTTTIAHDDQLDQPNLTTKETIMKETTKTLAEMTLQEILAELFGEKCTTDLCNKPAFVGHVFDEEGTLVKAVALESNADAINMLKTKAKDLLGYTVVTYKASKVHTLDIPVNSTKA